MPALEILFWLCVGLIVWTQIGYALALACSRGCEAAPSSRPSSPEPGALPSLSLIVAAHDEEPVIAAKVANARELDYPRGRLEIVVACDGCTDETAAAAREAGADLVLELPRGGKIRAQDAAVERSRGELLAFSDANALWEPDAPPGRWWPRSRIAASATPADRSASSGQPAGTGRRPNQEGLYWRYEMAVRGAGVAPVARSRRATARSTRPAGTPTSSSTPSWATTCRFPSTSSSAACAPSTCPPPARREKMVPTIERRVRPQAADDEPHLADPAARGDALAPRLPAALRADDRLPPAAALRHPRSCTSLALAANVALLALGAGDLYLVTLLLQVAAAGRRRAGRPACGCGRC